MPKREAAWEQVRSELLGQEYTLGMKYLDRYNSHAGEEDERLGENAHEKP